jgi:myo-inositol-1(or 4)-monophosphatase
MLNKLEQVLLESVQLAGSQIRLHTGTRMSVTFKTSWTDLVTEVDKAVEQSVRGLIQQHFPDHGFLGEEGGGGFDKPYTWVLDPLDGTTNFAHTLPNFVTSLACYHGQEALVAAVYDANRQELFVAKKGGGATLNGLPIRVDTAQTLQESLIGTNLMWDMREDRYQRLTGIQHLGRYVRGIRSLGAAALELAYVACGRLTGYCQYRLAPWDFAAGALLVQEAGGIVTHFDGRPLDPTRSGTIVASNGLLHEAILAHLIEDTVGA